MSGNHPPVEVLAARLEHELTAARLLVVAAPASATAHVVKAQEILAQLREAMR